MRLMVKALTVFCVLSFSSGVYAATAQERIDAVNARAASKIAKLEARYGGDPGKLAVLIARTEQSAAILIARIEALPSPN